MAGGLSRLVTGNMCCGITGTALIVRVGAEGREQALREAHVRPMQFAGRALSGFICAGPGAGREPGKPGWPRGRERDHGEVSWIVPQVTRLDEPFVADEGAILESYRHLTAAYRQESGVPHATSSSP
jgi:hypothetical protein